MKFKKKKIQNPNMSKKGKYMIGNAKVKSKKMHYIQGIGGRFFKWREHCCKTLIYLKMQKKIEKFYESMNYHCFFKDIKK